MLLKIFYYLLVTSLSLLYLLSKVHHSEFVPAPNTIGNMALLPLRTKFRGPAPMNMDLEKDIIDEALYLFKSLIFLRQYELKVRLHSIHLTQINFTVLP